jgi:hypothetical protein
MKNGHLPYRIISSATFYLIWKSFFFFFFFPREIIGAGPCRDDFSRLISVLIASVKQLVYSFFSPAFSFFKQRILVREAGLFIFIEVADLGLVLQWDHGTRIYLRLDPKWKGRVSKFAFLFTILVFIFSLTLSFLLALIFYLPFGGNQLLGT